MIFTKSDGFGMVLINFFPLFMKAIYQWVGVLAKIGLDVKNVHLPRVKWEIIPRCL